jgi:ribosomal-protein-alanine N-acetyltransferase
VAGRSGSSPPSDAVDLPEATRAGRTWLRRVRLDDAPAILDAYAADPTATRFLSWPPRQRVEDVAAWLAPKVAGWDEDREYRWVIADDPHGDAFGTVSLRRSSDGFELGYALSTDRSGEGVATAVVTRVLDVCAEAAPGAVVSARTDPANAASIRVLEKCGFVPDRLEPASAIRPGLGSDPRDTLVFVVAVDGRPDEEAPPDIPPVR